MGDHDKLLTAVETLIGASSISHTIVNSMENLMDT